MTMPPPTPKSPENNPANVPISPSVRVRPRGMAGILGRVSPALTIAEALHDVRAEPSRSAILLDVDGTLAQIVRHADDAHVPEVTRSILIEVSKRFGLVGCVSGRRAAIARQIVSIGSISYVGNHGGEILRGGTTEPEGEPEVARGGERVRAFRDEVWSDDLDRLRVRAEDKDQIAAFHWRGGPHGEGGRREGGGGADRGGGVEAAVRAIAEQAEARELVVHWGRKVPEARPPKQVDKGKGIRRVLAYLD